MQRTQLPLLLLLLTYPGWSSGLCTLEKGNTAHCDDLEDVKYTETYDLDTLKASVKTSVLSPDIFVNLTSLRHLDLSKGFLKQIEPGTFNKLPSLKSLNLAENDIEYLKLGSLDGLNHLHSLNLRDNSIQQLPPAVLRLKVLKHLDIHGNPLQCNCATLRVRDLMLKRDVKLSKKLFCAGPKNVKGTSLFKLDAAIICRFEEQDREMQNDQPEGNDSDEDIFSENEYVDAPYSTPEPQPKEVEIETPFPEAAEVTTASASEATESSSKENPVASTESSEVVEKPADKDEDIFFDSEERKGSTVSFATKKLYKDALLEPTGGSGDGEEGSGEGSGADTIFGNWQKVGDVEETSSERTEDTTTGNGLFDTIFNAIWGSTDSSTAKEDPDLAEEEFIDVSSTKETEEETPAPIDSRGATESIAKSSTSIPVELVNVSENNATLGKIQLDSMEPGVPQQQQPKKGMGSYVVLVALLAILATLIGFAAYKSDFCRKKRKRSDVERGTEMRDMQKSLLENSTQPKIASNGNAENLPLVGDTTDGGEAKVSNSHQVVAEMPRSANGTSEPAGPVKPPRAITPSDQEDRSSLKDDPRTDQVVGSRLQGANEPPLSPGAQRVKITLQENPDSVPKTPILITRTLAGENLVKTP